MRNLRPGTVLRVALLPLAAAGLLVACAPVEISRTDPWEAFRRQADAPGRQPGLPGSASLRPAGGAGGRTNTAPGQGDANLLRTERPDGDFTLNAILPRHLVDHLRFHLSRREYDVVYDKLVAEEARELYESRGHDPRSEIIGWLEDHRVDILLMLRHIPLGIDSPNVRSEQAGPLFRLRVHGHVADPLRYDTIDVIRENGNFRLLTIYRSAT